MILGGASSIPKKVVVNMNIFLIDVPLTNLKPALFLGKELEDMIHHNVFKVVLSHTDFTDPENEKVTIFAFRAEVDLSAVAWFISELKF